MLLSVLITMNYRKEVILLEVKKQIEYLHGLISDGIIDTSEGECKICMLKKNAVLEKHDRAINTRSNGRFVTKVRQDNKLIQVTAYTYEELINKLYDFYFGEANSTLASLYPLWIEYRRNETSTTEKTIKEDCFIWNAHLKGEEITLKPLKKLQPKDYITFFRKVTKGRNLTRKRFNNMKSVMNGIIYFSIEKDIITHNPLLDINYQQFSFKSENNEVIPYTEDERLQIINALSEYDIYDLAIKLSFYLTIRIGELKGLRFDDIQGDFIHVCRFVNDKHEIIDDIKGHASVGKRWLPLTVEAKRIIDIVKAINFDSEYLFMEDLENKKFITTVTFNRHLKKCCERLNIKYRSSHKIRFSTASILNSNGVSVPEVQQLLGHTTSTMTHHYLRNVNSRVETYEKVANIFV